MKGCGVRGSVPNGALCATLLLDLSRFGREHQKFGNRSKA
jgi:hypothetical protein